MAETDDGDPGASCRAEEEERALGSCDGKSVEDDTGAAEDESVTTKAHSCNMLMRTGAGRLSIPRASCAPSATSRRGEK